MQSEVLGIVGCVILCTLHLFAGFCLAAWFLDKQDRKRSFGDEGMSKWITAVASLTAKMEALSMRPAQAGQKIPAELLMAITQLVKANHEMQMHARAGQRAIESQPAAPHDARVMPLTQHPASAVRAYRPSEDLQEPAYDLPRGELHEFASAVASDPTSDRGGVEQHRYHYPCSQFAAECMGGELPEADQFFEVQGNDISSGGLSFFVKDAPKCERMVLTIGPASKVLFMLCQVVYARPKMQGGQERHLVGCRFIGRIDAIPDAYREIGQEQMAGV